MLVLSLPLFGILMLAAVGCRAVSFTEEDDVLVLNDQNFDEALRKFPELFVEFYAPWCGHCKNLIPIFAETAKTLKARGSTTRLAKLDATEYQTLRTKYNVTFFPTLKLFLAGRSDKPILFEGKDRTVSFFLRWLKKRTSSSPAETVETTAAVWDLVQENELAALGFFKDRNSAGAKAFVEVAAENDDYMFAFVVGSKQYEEFKVSSDRVVVFKQFDEGRADMKDSVISASSVRSFLERHRFPLVTALNWETSRLLYGSSHVKNFLLYFVDKTSPQFQTLINAIIPVAHAYQGKVMLIYIDITSEEFGERTRQQYGVTLSECPALIYYDSQQELKYKLSGSAERPPTWVTIQRFVGDAIDGKLTPFHKSEPVPEDWNANPVKVLVGLNFKDVALDNTKSVFVEFYAPWCGHCKELAPIWDQLAQRYVQYSELVIAKIDATANDIDNIKIRSFPTLMYFPRGGGEAVTYKGDHTLEALVKFINNGGKNIEEKKQESTKSEL